MSSLMDLTSSMGASGCSARIAWLPMKTNSFRRVIALAARRICSRSDRLISPEDLSPLGFRENADEWARLAAAATRLAILDEEIEDLVEGMALEDPITRIEIGRGHAARPPSLDVPSRLLEEGGLHADLCGGRPSELEASRIDPRVGTIDGVAGLPVHGREVYRSLGSLGTSIRPSGNIPRKPALSFRRPSSFGRIPEHELASSPSGPIRAAPAPRDRGRTDRLGPPIWSGGTD